MEESILTDKQEEYIKAYYTNIKKAKRDLQPLTEFIEVICERMDGHVFMCYACSSRRRLTNNEYALNVLETHIELKREIEYKIEQLEEEFTNFLEEADLQLENREYCEYDYAIINNLNHSWLEKPYRYVLK
jgi:hypothetical protein